MLSVDIELALVGLAAMLEPATLVSSMLTLVVGRRPLRTGSLFYLGGLGTTMAVGVVAAFVLGNAAAAPSANSPKEWVSILNILAGAAILAYLAWAARRAPDPEKTAASIARIRKLDSASALTIVGAGAVLANAGPFMLIALKSISQLNPSAPQYILDWTVFALASLLPLGVGLLLLVIAPGRAMPMLTRARGWIEQHARLVVRLVLALLAISLLRDGIAGLGV
jgi:hypothetical protein